MQAITLGGLQGIFEWLPVSSEAVITLLSLQFIEGITTQESIALALYLHMGTFLAALVYFRKEVGGLLRQTIAYKKADEETKKTINFYVVATLVSGVLGYLIFRGIVGLESWLEPQKVAITIILGMLLLITGVVQLLSRHSGPRSPKDLTATDSVFVGIAQGFAVIPGISRSGFTISALLLRGVDDNHSLKLSFILSLPIVLFGNIFLNTSSFIFTPELFLALVASFVLGLLTIRALLEVANKIKFGWFVLIFGALVIGSVFI